MEKFLEFFKVNNAQKQIDKLAKKYKGKKVVLYGAGLYASVLIENYDLSKLNIIGISDKRFGLWDKEESFYGYNTIPPNDLITMDVDVILISVQEYYMLKDIIQENIISRRKDKKVKALPIIKKSFLNNIIEIIEE